MAQRIERFLARKRADEASLTADESANVASALACFESARYSEGKDAMTLAEKGWQPRGDVGNPITAEASYRGVSHQHLRNLISPAHDSATPWRLRPLGGCPTGTPC
jgi:hypothetical protein